MSGGGHGSVKPFAKSTTTLKTLWWLLWKTVLALTLLNFASSEITRLLFKTPHLGKAGTLLGLDLLCFGMVINWLLTGERKPLMLSVLLLAGVMFYLWFISGGILRISTES